VGPQEVIVVGTVLAVLALPMLALAELRGHPAEAWRSVPHSRLLWSIVVVGLPIIGAALYLRRVRPQLRAAVAA
jgi:hypothetical protein